MTKGQQSTHAAAWCFYKSENCRSINMLLLEYKLEAENFVKLTIIN